MKNPMDELKHHFCVAMSRHSTRNKSNIIKVWDRLVEMHKDRSYHNLMLAYRELKTAETIQFTVPDQIIVAAVLRYANFNPKLTNNFTDSINYLNLTLDQAFGWSAKELAVMRSILFYGSKICCPTDKDFYDNRLIHDMKMSRYAKPFEDFLVDRTKAREEFKDASDYKFYNAENSILRAYQYSPELFSLSSFKRFTAQARETIEKRLLWIQNHKVLVN